MHTHHHHDHHSHHDADSGLADQLDLDARLTGPYLGELTGWLWGLAPAQPRRVADLGAGTGAHTLELARRFPQAEIVAVDNSAVMLDRIRAAAREQGAADRLRLVQADLDAGWPPVGAVDVVWAASSLHHVADPDRLLRDAHAALNPGGLLAVIEMDGLPRFLPDDPRLARPGLEERCRAAAAQAGWNAYPDWTPHLERAGFTGVERREFAIEADPAPPGAARYAHVVLSRYRAALDGRLPADDLDALGRLLADGRPDAVLHRRDLVLRVGRTAWAASREEPPTP
ncbi:methyltransferase domain-containing protein [Nonomuraea sp. MG754425]|uniref:class I SAM-dependent methyltransferase n=1 Tax=Nonomuraea sp. MG754425 TaxID=2570319 RepID=UPI001F284132|nr:class I SAM-dependent methyltransferase [Nonomuraea sp. MG754425]MCF6475373.1 methyltransferase domain-containing protein [Nonomuraea sp. MG754425]